MDFSEQIINWYKQNKRILPWRNSKNAYKIWLSEIILQQTKVAQGLPYFNKFISKYPKIELLAKASEDEVLKLWQGLGYYSRARNLHHTAKEIVEKYNSRFPNNYKEIRELKGIGKYTAAAICSFAFDMPYAVVDGNVIRILSRYFGVLTPFDTTKGKKEFENLAQQLLKKENPAENNQAIMEFGALQCTPKSPKCTICPLQNSCFAFHNKLVSELPKKDKKLKIKKRYFDFLIINEKEKMLIQKRENGIWKGLYQFPLIENTTKKSENEIKNNEVWKKIFAQNEITILKISPILQHQLTHQRIFARFWHINAKISTLENYNYIRKKELKILPIPKLLENYLQNTEII